MQQKEVEPTWCLNMSLNRVSMVECLLDGIVIFLKGELLPKAHVFMTVPSTQKLVRSELVRFSADNPDRRTCATLRANSQELWLGSCDQDSSQG